MAEIRVPALGESVTEATIGQWFKKPGEAVAVDEPLVELETDKVTVEVPAPSAGILVSIAVPQGSTVAVGAVLGAIDGAGARAAAAAPPPSAAAPLPPRPPPPRRAPPPRPPPPRRGAARPRRGGCRRRRRRHAAIAGRAQAPRGEGAEPRRRGWFRAPRSDPEGRRDGGRGREPARRRCPGP